LSGHSAMRNCRSSPGGVAALEVWCIDLRAAAPALSEIEARTPRLAPADRARAGILKDVRLAAERMATYIALRILIERAAGVEWRGIALTAGAHGKPHLEGAPVAFSLSHAPGLALIGVGKAEPIGVDVERARIVRVRAPRRDQIEAAGAFLSAEQELTANSDARLLQAWVRLEAFAKAQGCGIGRLLTRLGIMGGSATACSEIKARLDGLRTEFPAIAVRDLPLGEGLFAAVAAPPALARTEANWLPHSVAGIDALLAEGG
jgi:4'-phosphopantetheinyl transferase